MTTSSSVMELRTLPASTDDSIATLNNNVSVNTANEQLDAEQHEGVSSLPSVDHGKDAWLFIAGCFLVEATIWGFPSSFGVFQKYYSTKKLFASHGNVAAIGTSASVG